MRGMYVIVIVHTPAFALSVWIVCEVTATGGWSSKVASVIDDEQNTVFAVLS